MHQALGGAQGQTRDVEIHAKELVRLNRQMREFLAERTGRPFEEIARDFDRDRYMDAKEALDYGLVDAILEPAAPVAAGQAS
jgi:ATP-dependent Clp protease protease subunit